MPCAGLVMPPPVTDLALPGQPAPRPAPRRPARWTGGPPWYPRPDGQVPRSRGRASATEPCARFSY